MKKKYGLPLASSGLKAAATLDGGEVDGDNNVGMDIQASAGNSTPRKISRGRKTPKQSARKSPYKVIKREETNIQGDADNKIEGDRQSAMDTDELERMVFGEPDEEEEDDHQEYVDAVADNQDLV
jgi:hypothetical protein